MIKFGSKNVKFLKFTCKIPLLKHFFILKPTKSFYNVTDDRILNKFYTDIYVNSKTSKKTEKNRFIDIDIQSLKYIKNAKNSIHDIAVSSGITSLEYFLFLKKNNINFEMFISDKYSKVHIKEGFNTIVYDNDHNIMFGYLGCLFGTDKNFFFPLTLLTFKLLSKIYNNKIYDYILYLYHPSIIDHISKNLIYNIDYDIFETKIENKFTCIRCMNILNKFYFDDNQIISALKNIKLSLIESGLLILGRTDSKRMNNVSFFQKNNNKLILLEDINSGSEIKELIMNI
jgi:hypothetical protein